MKRQYGTYLKLNMRRVVHYGNADIFKYLH